MAAVAVAPRIGIGPALRKARLLRGKSIEEASRETRIRADYLRALEAEGFDDLLGDVYVRGFLRTYSTYLGLDGDKVVAAYSDRVGPHGPTLPDAQPAPAQQPKSPHPHLPAIVRRHPSWTFMVGVALLMLGVFAAIGLLARTPTDSSAQSSTAPITTDIPVLPPSVTARLAVEAGRSLGWERWVGSNGATISLDRYGASAPGDVVMREFGFTPDHVTRTAEVLVAAERKKSVRQ